MAKLEDVCPSYVGAKNITLALADPFVVPLAQRPIGITVTLTDEAETSGLVLPLELRIVAPSAVNFRQHFYRLLVPQRFAFTPREGGRHLVTLREVAHNRWTGSLLIDVKGETLDL